MKIIFDEDLKQFDFIPEDKTEEAKLEDLKQICATEHVNNLERMLYITDSLWESLMLAQQVVDDLEDYTITMIRSIEKKEKRNDIRRTES